VLQPREHNLLRRLLNLAGEEDLIEYGIDLIKIKNKIQLAHVPEKRIEHLHEEVYGLQIRKLVIIRIDAHAEEEAGVAAVDNLVVAELDKVALVLLVARGDEAVDFAFQFDFLLVLCSFLR